VLKTAHVVVLPRIGHVAMMERPDLVAKLVREFLGTAEPVAAPDAAERVTS
jgi:pimeloyl-ACP methyl ester carboxylesterase